MATNTDSCDICELKRTDLFTVHNHYIHKALADSKRWRTESNGLTPTGLEVPLADSVMAKELARNILQTNAKLIEIEIRRTQGITPLPIAHATAYGTARVRKSWIEAIVGVNQVIQRRE